MRFPRAGARVRMDATEELPGVSHYFVGSTTIPDVRHYASVTYRDLYRGISLMLRGKPAEIEYDFVVAPGANPARIRLTFEGIESAALTASGDLVLRTPAGEWRHKRPSAFQEREGKRRRVDVDYLLIGNKQIAFRVGRYDRGASLVIDPVVVYTSTPAPGGIHGLATDAVGNIYATGFLPGSGVCGSYSFFGRT